VVVAKNLDNKKAFSRSELQHRVVLSTYTTFPFHFFKKENQIRCKGLKYILILENIFWSSDSVEEKKGV